MALGGLRVYPCGKCSCALLSLMSRSTHDGTKLRRFRGAVEAARPRAGAACRGGRGDRSAGAGGRGVVRTAAEEAPAAARTAAAAGRGHRRRHEHRQVGPLQSPGRRSGQRRQPVGGRHEAPGLPGAAGTRRAGNPRAAVRPRSRSARGARPTIRWRMRPRTGSSGGGARGCRRGCCCSTRPTSIPTSR